MAEPFLGEIKIVSFGFAPRHWALCHGQLLPINQNQALFSLLGTQYGGNGQTTFALPDLRGRVPLHAGGGLVQGQSVGETTHTLTAAEMPAHSHSFAALKADASKRGPAGQLPAFAAGDCYSRENGGPTAAMNAQAIAPAGGSQPHENMQPYLVLNFVIALQGIYPSPN
jgi:microcystin-dependent protein